MLETLTARACNKIPKAVHSPVHEGDARFYWSRTLEGLTNRPDFRSIEKPYQNASLRFSAEEIYSLSTDEFLQLQESLLHAMIRSFSDLGIPVPENITQHLIPEQPKNVLIHEREHLDAVPVRLKQNSGIDVFLQRGLTKNDIRLNGIAYYNMFAATEYENAWVSSNPRSLGLRDISGARNYAQRTGNQDFIRLMEQRIIERENH